MKRIVASRLFWSIFIIANLLCLAFVHKYFKKVFPLVSLTISMDRPGATARARQLAARYQWKPENPRVAVSFKTDHLSKTYIELEENHRAFKNILTSHVYSPYTWNVRHFKEHDPYELYIQFTPEGKPYSFLQILPETHGSVAWTSEHAQEYVQTIATQEWNIPLEKYNLIESYQEKRVSGRVDHTFVYQWPERINQGLIRLRLVVSGDTLTEISPYFKVPEEFILRYKELRSKNNTIAWFAYIAMLILYMFGGCLFGLWYLLRKRFVLWRAPLLWGFGLALAGFIAEINELPLAWMNYHTALSYTGFLVSYIVQAFHQMLFQFAEFSLIFIAAESLTRHAFGNQLQLWKTWSGRVAASNTVLGKTIAGYLTVPLEFSFLVIFYWCATRIWGWWLPSNELFKPDILATYAPWLAGLIPSLRAGFVEECLYRAIPLAGATLLGRRYGRPRLWITISMILQAIVFGAAHATYAAQPAYARLVELLGPSVLFGWIYFNYGLLPTIISHIIYDVVWCCLPIFISSGSWAYLNQALVIICAAIPIAIPLLARIRYKGSQKLQVQDYNKSFEPHLFTKRVSHAIPAHPIVLNKFTTIGALSIAILSAICWTTGLMQRTNSSEVKPLLLNRAQALHIAHQAWQEKGTTFDHQWHSYALTRAEDSLFSTGQAHRYTWSKLGHPEYYALLNKYLFPAYWIVRTIRWKGSPVERAHEYRAYVSSAGTILRLQEVVPEAAPGLTISKTHAKNIAQSYLQTLYGPLTPLLEEISASSLAHPARTDWEFTFVDTSVPAGEGQARIDIEIAGNKLINTRKFMHIPEEVQRAYAHEHNWVTIIDTLGTGLYYLFLLCACLCACMLIRFTPRHKWLGAITYIIMTILYILQAANNIPSAIAVMNTAQPFYSQLIPYTSSLFISGFVASALFGCASFIATSAFQYWYLARWRDRIMLGLGGGVLLACAHYLNTLIQSWWHPVLFDYALYSSWSPILSIVISNSIGWIASTIMLLIFVSGIDYIKLTYPEWAKVAVLCFAFSKAFSLEFSELASLPELALSILFMTCVYVVLYLVYLRYDHAIIPMVTATALILRLLINSTLLPWSIGVSSFIITTVILSTCTYYLSIFLTSKRT